MRNGFTVLGLFVLIGAIAAVVYTRFGGAVMPGNHPALFDHRSYEDAKSAAASGKKLFIVKFTASWCGPCRQMDETTLVDKRVEDWVKAHAIAVAVDVDEHASIAEAFGVDGIPMVVAMKGDQTVGSSVGYQSPDEFLTWLSGLEGK